MSRSLLQAVLALVTAAGLVVSPIYAQDQQAPAPDAQSQAQPQTPAPPPTYQPPVPTQAPPASPTRDLKFGPDYSRGKSWFPDLIAPYTPLQVPQPDLTNTPRIGQLISDGKLNVSLEDAISLALENNLGVAVAQYTPWLDEANLLLAKSGQNGKTVFDPVVTASINQSQSSTPVNNPFFAGTGSVATGSTPQNIPPPAVLGHTFNSNFQYTQGFSTGTQAQVTFDNSRSSSSIAIDLFNPAVQSTLTVELTQPLLNGFGRLANTRYIIEAKNTVKVGESQFAQEVITIVTQVATDYWELVYARENVKVQQVAVDADQELYQNNKKQLEVGTMAPLDVITAQSQLASDQQALVQAQTNQLLDETTLLVAITKDPLAAQLQGVQIVPTTSIFTPAVEALSLQEAVQEAWQKRPELQQAALNLKNAGVEVKYSKNALLPTLNLFGEYSATGLGGREIQTTTTSALTGANLLSPIVTSAGVPVAPAAFEPLFTNTVTPFIFPGGLSDAWSRMIHGNYPTLEAGITLNLPIRNRAAQAANATALLNQREQQVQYLQTESTIVLNVRQALIVLEQDRAAIDAAKEARVYAQQSYDDQVKELQLGSSNAFTVVQKQQLLTAAAGTELRDEINLIEAELNLDQALGRTLDVHNIYISDALKGTVARQPNIPGTPDGGQPK